MPNLTCSLLTKCTIQLFWPLPGHFIVFNVSDGMPSFDNKFVLSLFLLSSLFLAGCSYSDQDGASINAGGVSTESSSSDNSTTTGSTDSNGSGGGGSASGGGSSGGVSTSSSGGATTVTSSYDGERGIPPTGTDTPQQSAARFLTQATFGPNMAEIQALASEGYDAWLDRQIAMSPTYHLPQYPQGTYQNGRQAVWWKTAVTAPDQLRQKVAYALSQIFVVSDTNASIQNSGDGLSSYYDVLVKNAFGNYRDLLEEVTLHPIMGMYLSMLRNEKPDQARGVRSDENYAREVMQLFSIGLVQLNLDGTPKLDQNGNTIPTYSQSDIENLARVFTGWTFNDCCDADYEYSWKGDDFINPMNPFEQFHDRDEKIIVSGVTIPAGGTARQDLGLALDAIFNHPNTGPFISKLLIQRLTTSNPSPEYISRVANVFNNNGSGVRGDLQAVIRTILMDNEALFGHVDLPYQFGKLREPLLRATHLWRAFYSNNMGLNYANPELELMQAPLRAPSVFNFYSPSYSPVGVIRDDGLKAPEFQITTESSVNALTNAFRMYIQEDGSWKVDAPLDISEVSALANDASAMIEYLNLLLMSGWMSDDMKQVLTDYLNNYQLGNEEAARNLIYLITTSSEYAVQR